MFAFWVVYCLWLCLCVVLRFVLVMFVDLFGVCVCVSLLVCFFFGGGVVALVFVWCAFAFVVCWFACLFVWLAIVR